MKKTSPPSPYTWFVRGIALPLGDRLIGQRMMKRLRFLEKAQWWDREQVYAFRDQLLAEMVKIAYHEVQLYRELMDEAGVSSQDIRTPGDLSKLPIITKDLLRSGYPKRTTRETSQQTYEECTSGSTGSPFCVQEDPQTTGWYRASFMLALEWAGWRIGEPHLQTGITPDRKRWRWAKDKLLRCHYVSAYDLTDAVLDSHLSAIERKRIRLIGGYPSSIYTLARRAAGLGWNQPIRSVVTWGDNLYDHYRETIERTFQTRVFDTYGCAEGIQVAAQCERGNYHIHNLDVIVEYLDDEDRPVPPGEAGHLILTRLHPGPMPLIRYRVGDLGISAGSRTCECGRGFELMESVEGRDTDIIVTPAGNRLIVHFFTGIIEHFKEVKSFQVVQREPGSILLRIVPAPDYAPEIGEQIIGQLKGKGADCAIQIEQVDDIPLTPGGKRRFVISELTGSTP
jgi:phenylacetate-CoA ligase